jgi:membrane associated rhomboid family serine protease
MVTLYFFGRVMAPFYDDYLGMAGFVVFYAGGLLASILPTYLRNRDNPEYRSLGASGAVSAVLFAFILLQPWSLIIVFVLPLPAILYAVLYLGYTIWMDRQRSDHINHSAHLWGALYGIVFTIAMEPRVVGVFLGRLTEPRFGM